LKRRHIYRVGAAYVVVAWATAQGVDMLSQVFELPGWIARPAVILLAVGFPVALVAAWIIESKPHVAVAATVRSKPTILDWTLLGALAVVLLLVGYQQIAPSADETTPRPGVDVAKERTAISLAVLPFANLSSDPEREFFSDGMTDEIASALAKVRDLRVVGRSSAFQFKGQNRDLRAIGQSLGATHLIEGSVRSDGSRLRITSQLTQADNGLQVWAETYDRELTDVFATQDDIAQAIAAALRVPLGLQPGGRLVSNRVGDVEVYQEYLRARALYRGARRVDDARSLLDQVLARDPSYAPAWALQAQLHEASMVFAPATLSGFAAEARRLVSEWAPKMEMAAQRAIELDPNLPDGYVSLALLEHRRAKPLLAEELFLKALALDPDHPDALDLYANHLLVVGRLKEALAATQTLRLLEPFVPTFDVDDGPHFWLNGERDAAVELLNDLPVGNRNRSVNLARIYATEARYDEAADALLEMNAEAYLPGTVEEAARILRTAPGPAASPQNLPRLGNLGFVYLHVGAADRYLEFLEDSVQVGFFGQASAILWHPAYASVRATERFKAYVRTAGLVEYWRAKGWPDLCRPVGADDFVCD
jgi:TolB-like protein